MIVLGVAGCRSWLFSRESAQFASVGTAVRLALRFDGHAVTWCATGLCRVARLRWIGAPNWLLFCCFHNAVARPRLVFDAYLYAACRKVRLS